MAMMLQDAAQKIDKVEREMKTLYNKGKSGSEILKSKHALLIKSTQKDGRVASKKVV